MRAARLSDQTWALRLELGEQVAPTIETFCAQEGINNAQISGIGSIDSPVLAHYSIKTRMFTKLEMPGIHEITGLNGNVALVDGLPKAHLHVTVTNATMNAQGGHLVGGTCSATLELMLTVYPSNYAKVYDEQVGLNVWDF